MKCWQGQQTRLVTFAFSGCLSVQESVCSPRSFRETVLTWKQEVLQLGTLFAATLNVRQGGTPASSANPELLTSSSVILDVILRLRRAHTLQQLRSALPCHPQTTTKAPPRNSRRQWGQEDVVDASWPRVSRRRTAGERVSHGHSRSENPLRKQWGS